GASPCSMSQDTHKPLRDAPAAPLRGLELSNGDVVSADLYIDASGPLRCLHRDAVSGESLESSLRVSCDIEHGDAPVMSAAIAHLQDDGGQFEVPLGDAALRVTLQARDDDPGPDEAPWRDNVIAIGLTASALWPVHARPARYLGLTLKQLVNTLTAAPTPELIDDYNQLLARDIEDARAYMELLRRPRSAPRGELATRIALYRRRGWLPPTDGRLIHDDDWHTAMLAAGVIPEHTPLMAQRRDPGALGRELAALRARVASVVSEFPSVTDYVTAARQAAEQTRDTGPTAQVSA
ncbi:MAG: tryptophan 7-halogenase, partial [Pseudomonadota bacterium]